MNEIKHSLKEQFLLLVENDALITWCKPKELWERFEHTSQIQKYRIYSLINQLEKYGYIKKSYDETGTLYYSETDKLTDFRVNHCQEKAIKVLNEKLRLLELDIIKKNQEIQLTRELSQQLPEINFCLKNHIKNSQDIIKKINNKRIIIYKILKNINECIY
jgi:hypothetical protein